MCQPVGWVAVTGRPGTLSYHRGVPYTRVGDPEKLRRLLAAVLMITADIELPVLLRHLVEEARSLAGARYGALGVLDESRTSLEQFLTVGLTDAERDAIGHLPVGRGVLGLLITEPSPLRLADLARHPEGSGFPAGHPPMTSFLGVPVRVRDEIYGNLYLTDKEGAATFSEEDEALVEALAMAAGIAIQNTRLNDRVRVMSILDDRDRIARDLHDRVIQRIFAVGMSLQGAARLPDQAQVAERLAKAVDDLDTTITEIRTAIFELGEGPVHGGLRHAVLRLADELAPTLGFRPTVTFLGPVDSAVSQRVADHLLAVVREALTNVGKHAGADHCAVTVAVADGLVLEVTDDGRGVQAGSDADSPSGGLGLGNLAHRAEHLGGTLVLEPADGGGTRLVWSVPLE